MKHLLLPFFLLSITTFSLTQENTLGDWCGTDQHNEQLEVSEKQKQKADSIAKKIEAAYREYLEGKSLDQFHKTEDDVYIVPLVVHVIHDNGEGNISYEQIQDGVRILNEDLRRKNPDTNSTRDIFKPHAGDAHIEFRLANIDPEGNCTNGVVRINDPYYAYNGGEQAKSLSRWPSNRYFNYWLVNDIGGGGGGGTILGYAQFPWSGINNTYGVMQRNDQFGSIGTASFSSGRTTVHEVGHCFGLLHTFQSGCGDDCAESGDGMCDTPPVSQSSQACLLSNNTCDNDTVGPSPFTEDVVDQVENYMSYNSCQNMVSNDQIFRMQSVLENFDRLANLVSESNLESTGVDRPGVLCKADFFTSNQAVCAGQVVKFDDLSYHNVTKWEWSFPGGNPATSTEQFPTVTYDSSGTYDVSLVVSDGVGTVDTTKASYITVLPESAQLPFIDGFEDYESLTDDISHWSIASSGGSAVFKMIDSIAYTGDKGVVLENFNEPAGSVNELVSNAIDLSHVSGEVTLSFRFAYRKRNQANNERVRILISNDCAESWAVRRTIFGSQLSDVIETEYWEPQSQDDWTTVHMTNITSAFWVDLFRVKFQFESDGGNNFYLDDINLYNWGPSELSVDEQTKPEDFRVYPNPASKEVNVAFSLENGQTTNIQLINAMGQTLEDYNIQGKAGSNLVVIPTDSFSKGVYLVKIRTDNSQQIKRVVIN